MTIVPLAREAIAWSAPPESRAGRPLVVMMHGFYGHESDWTPAFGSLPAGAVGASLRAPVPIGERWAWVDFATQGVGALSAAARGILEWLDELDAPTIALVGWSQGGAMAVHLMRQRPRRFAVAAMVGGFVWETRPHRGIADARPPVFSGMGEQDDVITPAMQRGSSAWLATHTRATERRYPGIGHELREPMVGDALGFVAEHL